MPGVLPVYRQVEMRVMGEYRHKRQVEGEPNTFSTCKALVSQLHPFCQEGITSKGSFSTSSLGIRISIADSHG